MKLLLKHLAGAFVLLLNLQCFVHSQLTPQQRCDLMVDGEVCIDCLSYSTCSNGVLTGTISCPNHEICDISISDGTCLDPTYVILSPICYCQTTGCYVDPNDSDVYVDCLGTSTPTTILDSCAASQEMNLVTCECINCPDCGFYTSETGSCPITYYYCTDSTITQTFTCGVGLCFDSALCSCQPVDCPTCGRYVDPSTEDGSEFCLCADDLDEDICGLACTDGTFFQSGTCTCGDQPLTTSSGGGKSTTPSTDSGGGKSTTPSSGGGSTSGTSTCQPCGLADDPGSDCSLYYTCLPDGTHTGTYHCPGNTCFDPNTCGCI